MKAKIWLAMYLLLAAEYNTNGQVTKITDYFYDNPVHQQVTRQRVTQSDGTILETTYKYAKDYDSVLTKAAYLQKMIDRWIWNVPIETTIIIEKGANDRKYIDATVVTRKVVAGPSSSELLMPFVEFKFKGRDGSIATFSPYLGTSDIVASASYRETLRHTDYDSQGNALSILAFGGDKYSYLYSYNGQYPVAQIRNASRSEVETALAGTSFAAMAARTNSTTIKAKLDSVRNALPNAEMISYTYRPLVGPESSIDAAGKVTYYEYDGLGRLAYIRNNGAEGNIRTSFCYNYAGQGVDCGPIAVENAVTPPFVTLIPEIDVPLPVTLIDFVAIRQENMALLTWRTSEESNSERFDIEHSTDGKGWTKIGSVASKVESQVIQHYSFKDVNPMPGENMYRLRMVDLDGTFSFSKIEILKFANLASIYPNPLGSGETLNIDVTNIGEISDLKIFDVNGKQVMNLSKPGHRINIDRLTSGIYVIQVTSANGLITTRRIVKQ